MASSLLRLANWDRRENNAYICSGRMYLISCKVESFSRYWHGGPHTRQMRWPQPVSSLASDGVNYASLAWGDARAANQLAPTFILSVDKFKLTNI